AIRNQQGWHIPPCPLANYPEGFNKPGQRRLLQPTNTGIIRIQRGRLEVVATTNVDTYPWCLHAIHKLQQSRACNGPQFAQQKLMPSVQYREIINGLVKVDTEARVTLKQYRNS